MRHLRLAGALIGVVLTAAIATLAAWAVALLLAVVGACIGVDEVLERIKNR